MARFLSCGTAAGRPLEHRTSVPWRPARPRAKDQGPTLMRIPSARRTLRVMLTRRQLLVRGGGATVALACFGALPGGAVAGPAALSGTHAETYVAILELINADPAY